MRKMDRGDVTPKTPKAPRAAGGVSAALETVARVLEPLSPEARARVVKAAAVLLDVDLAARPAEEEVPAPPDVPQAAE